MIWHTERFGAVFNGGSRWNKALWTDPLEGAGRPIQRALDKRAPMRSVELTRPSLWPLSAQTQESTGSGQPPTLPDPAEEARGPRMEGGLLGVAWAERSPRSKLPAGRS